MIGRLRAAPASVADLISCPSLVAASFAVALLVTILSAVAGPVRWGRGATMQVTAK
jgi:hypothetical protein